MPEGRKPRDLGSLTPSTPRSFDSRFVTPPPSLTPQWRQASGRSQSRGRRNDPRSDSTGRGGGASRSQSRGRGKLNIKYWKHFF